MASSNRNNRNKNSTAWIASPRRRMDVDDEDEILPPTRTATGDDLNNMVQNNPLPLHAAESPSRFVVDNRKSPPGYAVSPDQQRTERKPPPSPRAAASAAAASTIEGTRQFVDNRKPPPSFALSPQQFMDNRKPPPNHANMQQAREPQHQNYGDIQQRKPPPSSAAPSSPRQFVDNRKPHPNYAYSPNVPEDQPQNPAADPFQQDKAASKPSPSTSIPASTKPTKTPGSSKKKKKKVPKDPSAPSKSPKKGKKSKKKLQDPNHHHHHHHEESANNNDGTHELSSQLPLDDSPKGTHQEAPSAIPTDDNETRPKSETGKKKKLKSPDRKKKKKKTSTTGKSNDAAAAAAAATTTTASAPHSPRTHASSPHDGVGDGTGHDNGDNTKSAEVKKKKKKKKKGAGQGIGEEVSPGTEKKQKTKKPNSKKKKKAETDADATADNDARDHVEQAANDATRAPGHHPDEQHYIRPHPPRHITPEHHPSNVYILPEQEQEQPRGISASNTTGSSSLPDIALLRHYCSEAHAPVNNSDQAKQEADASWDHVRNWLHTHSSDEARAAAQQIGDQGTTALHHACRNAPPVDVVHALLLVARETTQCQDVFGWLPIHYACAAGSSERVLTLLVEAFPDSRTITDRRGRTPLHFTLGNSNPDYQVPPEVVVLLSASGAAKIADGSGMLPLHYACAYGASEECMRMLTEKNSDAITTTDRFGRTPLHFALSNAGRPAAPTAVRLLLGMRPALVNANQGGPLPLRFLAEYAATLQKDATTERDSARRCLEHLLSFNPDPTADFCTALQSLPDWLRERAVVTPTVQILLNEKIAQRFPTGVLLSDFFVQVVVIICYAIVVPIAVDRRFEEDSPEFGTAVEPGLLVPLYLGGLYFFMRALVQVLSLLALGAFRIWVSNPSSWLDLIYIFVLFYWSTRMLHAPPSGEKGEAERETFRTGTALSVVVLWVKLLAYLRNTYVDFAVFLGGLFYVARRLVAFLLCLCITLIAFSQMFFTIYRQSDPRCTDSPKENATEAEIVAALQNEDIDFFRVYCYRWSAFLNCYTMLLGEVDETQFTDDTFAVWLFVLFMFFVVILLANVLIAVVTDSYKIIRDQRAAIVFWTNRLYFITEMDAIANGPWRNRVRATLGLSTRIPKSRVKIAFGRAEWDRLMGLYEDDMIDDITAIELVCSTAVRLIVALFLVPLWLLVGLLSFGWLWPPQVREAFFTSTVLEHSSDSARENELRKAQVKLVKDEVVLLKDGIQQELAIDRTHVVQMKSHLGEKKLQMQGELKNIKRIVNMLFEQQSSVFEQRSSVYGPGSTVLS